MTEIGWRGQGNRPWVAYFFWNGWENINLGISICLAVPNVELHVPFGFFRFGREASADYPGLQRGWLTGKPWPPANGQVSA